MKLTVLNLNDLSETAPYVKKEVKTFDGTTLKDYIQNKWDNSGKVLYEHHNKANWNKEEYEIVKRLATDLPEAIGDVSKDLAFNPRTKEEVQDPNIFSQSVIGMQLSAHRLRSYACAELAYL